MTGEYRFRPVGPYRVTVWRKVPFLGALGVQYLREVHDVTSLDSLDSVVELATRDGDEVRISLNRELRQNFD